MRPFVHGLVVGRVRLVVLEYDVLDVAPELSNKRFPQRIFLDLLDYLFVSLGLVVVCSGVNVGRWLKTALLEDFAAVGLHHAGREHLEFV